MDLRLTEYEQTANILGNDDVYEIVAMNNVQPLLVRKSKTLKVLHQSGQAVAWFARMIPPEPLGGPTAKDIEPPHVEYARIKNLPFAWMTTWEYVRVIDDAFAASFDVEAACAWPSAPEFAS